MESSLNLLGVTALLGSDVAKGAIRYLNTDSNRCATSLFVVPGLYTVSVQMLKRSDGYLAHVLSPGSREDKRNIVGMKASNVYRYIGMRSGTHAPVQNALCEGWMTRMFKNTQGCRSKLFREGGRPTAVHSVVINKSSPKSVIQCIEKPHMALSSLLQLAAVAAAGMMVKTKSIAGISLLASNMLSNLLINLAVTNDEYLTPGSSPAQDVPPGDSIVTNNKNEGICVVRGNETNVQNFMQLEVHVNPGVKYRDTAVSIFGCITSVATVLLMPVLPQNAKLAFAAQLLIGLLSGAVYSSRDGDAMLERLANKYYFDGSITTDRVNKVMYSNRATAIAAAFFETGGRADNLRSMVPIYDEHGNWELYIRLLEDMSRYKTLPNVLECGSFSGAVEKMCELYPESAGKLHAKSSFFSKRLVADALEAALQKE